MPLLGYLDNIDELYIPDYTVDVTADLDEGLFGQRLMKVNGVELVWDEWIGNARRQIEIQMEEQRRAAEMAQIQASKAQEEESRKGFFGRFRR